MRDNGPRWHLTIQNLHSNGDRVWDYSSGKRITAPRIESFTADGSPQLDYNPTAFGVTVVSAAMANTMLRFAELDTQVIPARVTGESDGKWFVLNATHAIECIDHEKSRLKRHEHDHKERPGEIAAIYDLVIDSSRVLGRNYFRIAEWKTAEIVSDRLRRKLLDNHLSGLKFLPVTK